MLVTSIRAFTNACHNMGTSRLRQWQRGWERRAYAARLILAKKGFVMMKHGLASIQLLKPLLKFFERPCHTAAARVCV